MVRGRFAQEASRNPGTARSTPVSSQVSVHATGHHRGVVGYIHFVACHPTRRNEAAVLRFARTRS
ncbi:hypothetical protein C8Q77DRAFT_1086236 [Trametes polyzona]|nr:hypothetical protein C8Q77DRAFT_1086236 [Trametes polyzona]